MQSLGHARRFSWARRGLGASLILASIAASRICAAQPLPGPFPIPPIPLPPPSFDTQPSRGATPTPTRAPASVHDPEDGVPKGPVFGVPSEAEREALRRSRIHESWYGWQTLGFDAATVAVILVGAAISTKRPPTLYEEPRPRPTAFVDIGAGIFLTGPPIVHFAHGNLWQGLGSASLRVAAPIVGYLLGSLVDSRFGGSAAGPSGSTFGLVIGGVGAATIDATMLGWDRFVTGSLVP
jgi:hypothetical protein